MCQLSYKTWEDAMTYTYFIKYHNLNVLLDIVCLRWNRQK